MADPPDYSEAILAFPPQNGFRKDGDLHLLCECHGDAFKITWTYEKASDNYTISYLGPHALQQQDVVTMLNIYFTQEGRNAVVPVAVSEPPLKARRKTITKLG